MTVVGHCGGSDWDQYAMRVGIPYTVKAAEQPVPSLVWLEARQEKADFRRIVSKAFSAELSYHAGGVLGEGEPGVTWIASNEAEGAGVNRVVKRIPKVAGRVFYDGSDAGWELRRESNLVDVLMSFRIKIDNAGEWARVEEGFDFAGCFFNVFTCSIDEDTRAIKCIIHA